MNLVPCFQTNQATRFCMIVWVINATHVVEQCRDISWHGWWHGRAKKYNWELELIKFRCVSARLDFSVSRVDFRSRSPRRCETWGFLGIRLWSHGFMDRLTWCGQQQKENNNTLAMKWKWNNYDGPPSTVPTKVVFRYSQTGTVFSKLCPTQSPCPKKNRKEL